ncbi:hypothetical protein D6D29_10199 [Aureobasidium pullulans]|nr:hypothetical protein D6D29_10199 [Aureobasidium pullulans]
MAELPDRIRLHISPFNATLYENIIPKSIQPNATNVSYHSVQTFPERGFGFVELPREDADKLRKKLNGFTLRGQKMAISEAKPEKRRRRDKDEDAAEEVEEKPRKKAKKEKSSKKKDKEITGFELPDERQVKRGWTEEPGKYHKEKKEKSSKSSDKADKKDKTPKREKSKYSSKQEVLFKQKLPEGVMMAQKAEGKEKKSKKTKQPKNITIIHEFEKNKPVPSFLKSEVSGKGTATADFVPGKGWVDAEGNVVEEVHVKPKREERIAKMKDTPVEIKIKPTAPKEPAMHKDITAGAKALGDDDSSDESSVVSSESDMSDDSDDADEDDEEKEAEREEIQEEIKEGAEEIAAHAPEEQQESTPASEPEEASSSDSEDESPTSPAKDTPTQSSAPDTMDIDTPKPSTPPREVHPLEALFKKKPATETTPRPAPINTSFSFGISDDIDEDVDMNFDAEADPTYPSTPYTRTRDIRSAAPTPDTAAIGRKFSFSFAKHFDEEDIEEEAYDEEEGWQNANQEPLGVREVEGKEGEEETEFAKWFWENRGDSNRAWKKRRRDVMKQKRQRENRRVSRRVV